jgi:hypothetical protein
LRKVADNLKMPLEDPAWLEVPYINDPKSFEEALD